MNERQLKSLFCKALMSGSIRNNSVIPEPGRGVELRIVEEAHFGAFDLLVAAVSGRNNGGSRLTPAASGSHERRNGSSLHHHYRHYYYDNALARTDLMYHFARRQKCRIDSIRFFPVEVKSDCDSIDGRLANQVIDAILTFGQSIVVLDEALKAPSLGQGTSKGASGHRDMLWGERL